MQQGYEVYRRIYPALRSVFALRYLGLEMCGDGAQTNPVSDSVRDSGFVDDRRNA